MIKIKENKILSFCNKYKEYLLSFFIPFLFITIAFGIFGIYPFGNRQIMNYDGWHQYYPFLMRLWDNIHGGNLFYDRSLGMGSNFLSLSSYYSASPLNILYLLSPSRDNRVLYTLFVCIRMGLAGTFSYMLLNRISRKKEKIAIAFSTAYALCGFMVGYYWNVMWLDGAALCPLICLGIILLVDEGKGTLYIISLFIALFSNYYIGYMCCIFAVISIIILWIINKAPIKKVLRDAVRFALFSLIGGGMAMILLLPAYFGLLNSYSATNSFPTEIFTYYAFSSIMAGMCDLNVPTVLDGLPNIYTGAAAAFFANAFLWAKRIKFREKIAALFLIIFLMLSFNVNALDFIWHGFHFTNMLPARFAFIFSLIIVIMAYRYYSESSDESDYIDIIGMVAFSLLLAVCAYFNGESLQMAVTSAVFSVLIVICTLYSGKILNKKVFSAAVCIILLAESAASAYMGVKTVGTTSYSDYMDNTTYKEIEKCTAHINEIEDDTSFFRTEENEWYSLNDSAFYGYRGITQFSSAANVRASRFAELIGLSADAASNRFAYVNTTPLNNTLLAVKYIIARTGYLSDTDMKEIKVPETKNASLYEYSGFRGAGLFMPKDALDLSSLSKLDTAPDTQNKLFMAATGIKEPYLLNVKYDSSEGEGLELSNVSENEDIYYIDDKISEPYIKYQYTAPKTGMYYIYANVPDAEYILVNNAWHNISEYPNYFSAGYFSEGEKFTLKVNFEDIESDTEGNAEIYVTYLDEEMWRRGLDNLSSASFVTTDYSATSISGYTDFEKEGYLYLSIPYESGWKAYIDGKKTEFDLFAGSMCGFILSEGHHEIKLEYMPKGFISGAIISAVSIIAFIFVIFFEKKGKRLLFSENDMIKNDIPKNIDDNGEKNDASEIDVGNEKGN